MQTRLKLPVWLFLSVALWSARGQEQTAIVNEGKINVRGQPSLVGEVVTQLKKGDRVTVLDAIRNERAKAGEPTNWAKIKLPANTPVWVYGEMVKDGAVSANRLNLRAGPGENYSVIGRINRGDKITSIRSMGDWIEIEAPAGAYAFVDATLLTPAPGSEPTAAPVSTPEPPAVAVAKNQTPPIESTPPPALNNTPPPVSTPEPETNPARDALASAVQTPPTEQPHTLPQHSVVTAQPTTTTPAPLSPAITTPSITAAAPDTTAPQRRIVRREGIVRPTVSIQAPTWYELVHAQTKKTIDYLHEEKLGIKLKQFKGQKVIVSGEEVVDPRWPNTPILEIETLDIAP